MKLKIVGLAALFCFSAVFVSAKEEPKAKMEGILLDGFETNDWQPANGDGCTIKLFLTGGKEGGKALKIDYDLKDTKQWVAVNKDIAIKDYEGKVFQFYVKASGSKTNNLEVKLVDEDGTNYGYKIPLAPNNQWEKVSVNMKDFTYWWGGNPKLDSVKSIYFAVAAIDGGNGTVILDDLRTIAPQKQKSESLKSGIIDFCDSLSGWAADGEEGTTHNLSLVPGKEKQAVKMDYNLNGKTFVQIHKPFPDLKISSKSIFSFHVKKDGDPCALEFKIVDKDGTNFGKRIEGFGKIDPWQEMKIPFSELSYFFGGDPQLDTKNIDGIWIAMSSGNGGKGSITIDQFKVSE